MGPVERAEKTIGLFKMLSKQFAKIRIQAPKVICKRVKAQLTYPNATIAAVGKKEDDNGTVKKSLTHYICFKGSDTCWQIEFTATEPLYSKNKKIVFERLKALTFNESK